MKFTKIFGAALGLASVIGGVIGAEQGQGPILQQSGTKVIEFDADYTIKERPEVAPTDVAQLYNGDSITLSYTVTNKGAEQVTVLGVGGTFRDAKTNEINTNITSGSIGPLVLEKGQSQQFSQIININLLPDDYILVPILYISYEDEFLSVTPRPQWTEVRDPPVSFFNPQLLFLELVLVVTFGGIGYIVYELFGKKYIKGTSTAPTKKVSGQTTGTTTGADGKSYDSSWIPQGHIKKKKN